MSFKMNQTGTHWWLRCGQALAALLMAAGLAACSTMPPQRATELAKPSAPAGAAPVESTLGTQWGEGRESPVRYVQAARINPDRPQAVAQMRYSDEAAIRRALGRDADRQLNVLLAGGEVEWSAQDEQGRPLPIFSPRGGQEDYLVAGRNGERYELVYVNRSSRDYEIVATVDGLDVLTGQPGSVRSSGYVLYSGQTLRITGFRKSQNEVAAFRFAVKDRAYASNTPAGDARNVGVIGSALYEVRVDERDAGAGRSRAGQGRPDPFPADPPARPYAPPPQYNR